MPTHRLLQSALADKSTAYGVSTNIILTNLLINFGLFLACCALFSSSRTRPLLRRAFSPRLFYCPESTPREPPSWNPLQWVYYVRALPDDVFMTKIGLDALMFVKTNASFAQTFAQLSVLLACILVPVNASFGYIRENVHSGGTSFAQYTMANVPERSDVFFLHACAAYIATLVAMLNLRQLYLDYVRLRHLHLLQRTPQQSTVMLHHIPQGLQTATGMYRFFDALFPGEVASIGIVLRLPKLRTLLARYESAKRRLEAALVQAVQSAKAGRLGRPTIYRRRRKDAVAEPLGWALGWTSGVGWPFVSAVQDDAIGYWHREMGRLHAQIRGHRWECAVWHAEFERSQALGKAAPPAAAAAAAAATSAITERKRARSDSSSRAPRFMLSMMGSRSMDADAGRPRGGSDTRHRDRGFSDLDSVAEDKAEADVAEPEPLLAVRHASSDDSAGHVGVRALAAGYSDLKVVTMGEDVRGLSMSMPSYMREQLISAQLSLDDARLPMSQSGSPVHDTGANAPAASTAEEASANRVNDFADDGVTFEEPADAGSAAASEPMSFFEIVRQRCSHSNDSNDGYDAVPRRSMFDEMEQIQQLFPFADAPPRNTLPSFGSSLRALDGGQDTDCCGCLGTTIGARQSNIPMSEWQREWLQRASPAAIQEAVAKGVHYVLGNPLSSTAFVTFYTLRAASIVRGYNGPLHPTPSAMIPISSAHKADWSLSDADAASYTPEPRDVFWTNVCETWQRRPLQGLAGQTFAAFIILTIAIPVAIISGFANVDSLREQASFINDLVVDSQLVENLLALVSPLLLMWLLNLVPPVLAIFQRFVSGEARSMSENQALVFRRFFSFLYYNAFLVLALTTSAYETMFEAVQHPKSAITNLGISLPKASAFYIQFIIIRTFAGLGFELARINRFVLAGVKFLLAGPDQTDAQRETPVIGCRSFDRPGPLYLGRYYADALLLYLLTMAYCVVAPLVLPFGAMYFALAYIIFKRQLAYVYEKEYETGGALWPGVQRRCYVSIVTSQIVLLCVLAAKLAWTEFALVLPLPLLTMVWQQYMTRIYGSASRSLPLIVAAAEDKRIEADLRGSSESYHLSQRFSGIRDAYTQPELKKELEDVDADLLRMALAMNVELDTSPDSVALGGAELPDHLPQRNGVRMRRRPRSAEEPADLV